MSGVDVSRSAIHQANQRYTDPARSSYPHCILHRRFVVGDAVTYPSHRYPRTPYWPQALEHVEPRHVKQVISEMARVARTYLFLLIASQPSMSTMTQLQVVPKRGNWSGSELIIKDYGARVPHPMEVSLRPQAFWVASFESRGYVLERNIPLPNWSCCAFVLRRNTSTS